MDTPLLFDLTGRGHIVLTGKDRAAFLHGLVTNDVKKLTAGHGCYAAFLTPKGKTLADLTVYALAESLVVDCEASLVEKLDGLLLKYLIFQEVVIENRSAETAVLHVAGAGAAATLATVGLTAPAGASHDVVETSWDGAPALLAVEARTGEPGVDVRLPRERASDLIAALRLSSSPPELLERRRILAGIPRWGAELDENVLPNEARLERNAISYNKGCYIGQETVARIKTYGHVNRLLCRLRFPAGSAVAAGDEISATDGKAGRVTSVATADDGTVVALGFVKRERAKSGEALMVGAATGTVDEADEAPPPAPPVRATLPLR